MKNKTNYVDSEIEVDLFNLYEVRVQAVQTAVLKVQEIRNAIDLKLKRWDETFANISGNLQIPNEAKIINFPEQTQKTRKTYTKSKVAPIVIILELINKENREMGWKDIKKILENEGHVFKDSIIHNSLFRLSNRKLISSPSRGVYLPLKFKDIKEVQPSGNPNPPFPLTQLNKNILEYDIIEVLIKNKAQFQKGMDINEILFALKQGGRKFLATDPRASISTCLHKAHKVFSSGIVKDGNLWRYEVR